MVKKPAIPDMSDQQYPEIPAVCIPNSRVSTIPGTSKYDIIYMIHIGTRDIRNLILTHQAVVR